MLGMGRDDKLVNIDFTWPQYPKCLLLIENNQSCE